MDLITGSLSLIGDLQSVVRLLSLFPAYWLLLAIYNISPLHPLYKFPGPKLAAATYLYEAYYDWWKLGTYGKKLKRMHDQYGPVVRINPHELHCNDPAFTDEIYASGGGRIRDKWTHQLNTGVVGPIAVTGFATISHELHRSRRNAMNSYFSRQQMLKLEGEVLDFAQRTADKMLTFSKEPFDVKEAFNCFGADVIAQYAFGEPMGFVDQEGWEPNFATWVKSFAQQAYMMRHNALARKLAVLAPMLANYMGEDMRMVMRQMRVVIPTYVEKAISDPQNSRVFAHMVTSDKLPKEEKSTYRLSGEGFNLLFAGTETTGATLSVIVYYLLSQRDTYDKLLAALQGVDPARPQWTDLERRPYLWAVVHEALRMTPGLAHRSARIARNEDLVYTSADQRVQWVIPRGTPIGMTSMINHYNEDLFPQPEEYSPERWLLEDGQINYALEKKLISFGKGTRDCLGKQLAYCELYIMTAILALRVLPRARLHNTSVEDIKYDHDMIVIQTVKGSISVRIAIS